MGKVRLQDLAKELGVKVKDVQGLLKEWGIEKNNFAYLEEEEIQIVLDHFGKETTQEVKEEKKEEKVESVQEKEPPKEKKPPQKVKEEERKKETFKREEKPLPKKEEKPATSQSLCLRR
jgi:translation initiation factor IF-2